MTVDIYANKGPVIIAADVILICLSTTFLLLRLLSRFIARCGLWWDDYVILAALPLVLVLPILNIIGSCSPFLGTWPLESASSRNSAQVYVLSGSKQGTKIDEDLAVISCTLRFQQTSSGRTPRCRGEMAADPLCIGELLCASDSNGQIFDLALLRTGISCFRHHLFSTGLVQKEPVCCRGGGICVVGRMAICRYHPLLLGSNTSMSCESMDVL